MKGVRAVFLDRDGVINRCIVRNGKPYPPDSAEEMQILPGVPEALRRLKDCGFVLVVVTNQPDVARGKQRREIVEAMHRALLKALPLDEICVCYHDDSDGCQCRKPLAGLLRKAARDYRVDLAGSFMVGDRWRDMEAGQNAGCKTIFIDYGYTEPSLKSSPDLTVHSLIEAVDWILDKSNYH